MKRLLNLAIMLLLFSSIFMAATNLLSGEAEAAASEVWVSRPPGKGSMVTDKVGNGPYIWYYDVELAISKAGTSYTGSIKFTGTDMILRSGYEGTSWAKNYPAYKADHIGNVNTYGISGTINGDSYTLVYTSSSVSCTYNLQRNGDKLYGTAEWGSSPVYKGVLDLKMKSGSGNGLDGDPFGALTQIILDIEAGERTPVAVGVSIFVIVTGTFVLVIFIIIIVIPVPVPPPPPPGPQVPGGAGQQPQQPPQPPKPGPDQQEPVEPDDRRRDLRPARERHIRPKKKGPTGWGGMDISGKPQIRGGKTLAPSYSEAPEGATGTGEREAGVEATPIQMDDGTPLGGEGVSQGQQIHQQVQQPKRTVYNCHMCGTPVPMTGGAFFCPVCRRKVAEYSYNKGKIIRV
jgi:hypothetical protein